LTAEGELKSAIFTEMTDVGDAASSQPQATTSHAHAVFRPAITGKLVRSADRRRTWFIFFPSDSIIYRDPSVAAAMSRAFRTMCREEAF
uniref:PH domain-containing protein n=1 Tax=Haemonchus placei TaxID=6290 RepID=A0A0N4VVP5_HAEPC